MFEFLRKKKNEIKVYENKKEEKDYSESYSFDDDIPMFTTMVMVDLAHDIGIVMHVLAEIMDRGSVNESAEAMRINELIKQVEANTNDKDFVRKVRAKLLFVRDYTDFVVENGTIKANLSYRGVNYKLNFIIRDNYIMFNSDNNIYNQSGILKKNNDGTSLIKYIDKEIIRHDCNGQYYCIAKENVKWECYDKNNVQFFEHTSEKTENYKEPYNGGTRVYEKANVFYNFTDKEYRWRVDNGMILKRSKRDYGVYEKGETPQWDFYYIGRDEALGEKKMVFGGTNYGFDKSMYIKYKQGKATVKDLMISAQDEEFARKSKQKRLR